MRYTVTGEGPPVLLIHGFAVNIEFNWIATINDLARDYRVIAFDCRGHGRSDKPHVPEQYGKQMVDDAVRLLDHLDVPRAHVVGYSMGSLIAGRVAAYHPERVESLVLGGGGLYLDEQMSAMRDELAQSLEEKGSIAPLLRALHPPNRPAPTDAQIATANAFLMAINDPRALAAVTRSFDLVQAETPATFAPLRDLPVLAVIGSDDPLRRSLAETRKLIPEIHVELVPAGDHMTTLGHPRFLAAIHKFLDEQSRDERQAGEEVAAGEEVEVGEPAGAAR